MDVKTNKTFCLLGAGKLRYNLRMLFESMEGGRNAKNIEAIHDLRVASRRLRMGLFIYGGCYPKRILKKWKKQLRRMTKRLGPARDLDVQMEVLRKFLTGLPQNHKKKYAEGIERLLLRLRQQRNREQPKLIRVMKRLQRSSITTEMKSAIEGMAKKKRSQSKIYGRGMRLKACRLMRDRLTEMLAYESFVTQPTRENELHRMRIAAKHLRYTMEYFEPLFNGKLKPYIRYARDVQRLLGEFHDCTVWMELLPRFSQEERMRTVEYFGDDKEWQKIQPGLDYFLFDRSRKRSELYLEFLTAWKEMNRKKVWKTLMTEAKECKKINTKLINGLRCDGG